MITSFFKKKGEAAADAPAPASASSVPRPVKRPIDEALGEGASKTDASPSEPTAGAKAGRRRKATIHDSDDEDGAGNAADTTPVPPLPPLPEVSISGTRVAPINTTSEPTSMEMDEAAPSMMATAALAQTQPATAAGLSADAKVPAATAAKKAPVAAAAIKAQKAAEAENKADSDEDMDDEEVEDEAEDEEDGEEGEDVDAAGASSSGKARLSHSKVSKGKPVGTTAAKIAYNKYDVEAAATWKAGEPVPYLFLARVFGRIEAEPKRLLITELMANAFRTVIATSPDDLLPLMSLATNKLAPAYEGIELGIGDSIMIKAVSETCGRSVAAIKADLESTSDMIQCLALCAIANIGGKELAEAVKDDVQRILFARSIFPVVRKKAALCLLRLVRVNRDLVLDTAEWKNKLTPMLEEKNLGVVLSVVSLILGLADAAGRDAAQYDGCTGHLLVLLGMQQEKIKVLSERQNQKFH